MSRFILVPQHSCVCLRRGRKSQCCCVDSWPVNTVSGGARLPLASAATSTVTPPCSFPRSWKPPAGYVKCFHMKHILVKSVKHPVSVPNWILCHLGNLQKQFCCSEITSWANNCARQRVRHSQTDTWKDMQGKKCYCYFIRMYFSWLITSFRKTAWSISSFLWVIMWSSGGREKKAIALQHEAPLPLPDQISKISSLSQKGLRLVSHCYFL